MDPFPINWPVWVDTIPKVPFPIFVETIPGIYPDLLHILDLAIYCDMYASAFLVYTDDASVFPGRSRDDRLHCMYKMYIQWCSENRCWSWFRIMSVHKFSGESK